MKIILALFGFFVAACCLPAPQILQRCTGGNCNQQNAVKSGSKLKIKQDCGNSNCEQDNGEINDDFFGSSGGFFGTSGHFGDIQVQNCNTAECLQQNQGRKKRATVQAETVEKTQTYTCPGNGINGIRNQCRGNICEIICSDNTRYQHDCGNESSQVSTSGNVVTVTCGVEPVTYAPCFPFCPDTGSSSGTSSGTNSGSGIIQPPPRDNFPSGGPDQQPPANDNNDNVVSDDVTALKSCIDSCPVNNSYRGCVNECLRNRK